MNITNLRKEMEEELVGNILPFWLNKMTDKANGGFYGRISGTGILMPETEKRCCIECPYSLDFLGSLPFAEERRIPVCGNACQTLCDRSFL